MNPLGAAASSKWVILAMYVVIFLEVIVGLGASTAQSISDRSAMPFIEYVGDTTLGADNQIYESVIILMDDSLHASNPEIYDSNYLNYLRDNIIKNLFILFIVVFLFFKFYGWLLAQGQNDNLFKPILSFVFSLLTVATLEFSWVIISTGDFIIPLHGLGSLIMNVGEIWVFSSGQDIFNASTTLLNTTNSSVGVI